MNAALSGDETYLAVAHGGQSMAQVMLVDLRQQKVVQTIRLKDSWQGIAFSGSTLFVSGGYQNCVYTFRLENGALSSADTIVLAEPNPKYRGVAAGLDPVAQEEHRPAMTRRNDAERRIQTGGNVGPLSVGHGRRLALPGAIREAEDRGHITFLQVPDSPCGKLNCRIDLSPAASRLVDEEDDVTRRRPPEDERPGERQEDRERQRPAKGAQQDQTPARISPPAQGERHERRGNGNQQQEDRPAEDHATGSTQERPR
jgi:hypothetical protein